MGLAGSLAGLLFPTRCVVCGSFGPEPLCVDCLRALPRIRPPVCPRCGAPRGSEVDGCRLCAARALPYSQCRSILRFEEAGRDAIHALKYANARRMAPILASVAATGIEPGFFEVDVITFVPLHAARESERGYNQSELVARSLSCLVGVPAAALLRQVRSTADQAKLTAEERHRNVHGAYAARSRNARLSCGERRIMLVDDVFTTGATAGDCSRALREAGARDVRVLTLARAPLC